MIDDEQIVAAILDDPLCGVRSRADFPTTQFVRVCDRIEPERELAGGHKFELPLAERWQKLTQKLPLVGASAMRLSPAGAFPALTALARQAPWTAPLIDIVERQLRTQLALGRPWLKLEPLLLVGPPGLGKTWIAKRMGEALGVPVTTLQFGNMTDDRALSGTARGWTNAFPAWPLVAIARTGIANPLLILDEIDKAGGSARNGRPLDALLSLLEPQSARRWHDPCLLADCDLSHLNWIACANSAARLPPALVSRFQLIELGPPAPEHFDAALTGIIQDFGRSFDLAPANFPELPPRARDLLRRRFVRTRSIRALARDARTLLGAMVADRGVGLRH